MKKQSVANKCACMCIEYLQQYYKDGSHNTDFSKRLMVDVEKLAMLFLEEESTLNDP
jgi:hypothetical protein